MQTRTSRTQPCNFHHIIGSLCGGMVVIETAEQVHLIWAKIQTAEG
jgi:hypothetical protein